MASDCYSLEDVIVPLLIVASCGVFTFICWFSFCWKYNDSGQAGPIASAANAKNPATKDARQIKIMALIALTMYLGSDIIFLIAISSVNDCTFGFDISPVGFILHFFGFTMVLMTFTVRIFKTFENTSYSINKKHINFIYYIFTPFLAIVIVTLNILRVTEVIHIRLIGIIALIFVFFLILYAIWLLRLFIKKLNIVIYDFIKQFGKVSNIDLANLNKSVSYVNKNYFYSYTFYFILVIYR